MSSDIALRDSLRRRMDDLAVLIEWAEAGGTSARTCSADSASCSRKWRPPRSKKMLGGEMRSLQRHHHHPPGRRRHRVAGLGGNAPEMYAKWAERRGFKREVFDFQPGEQAGIKAPPCRSPATTPTV